MLRGCLAIAACLLAAGCGDRPDAVVRVHAAASLTDVMGELAARFETDTGDAVTLNLASSALAARQVIAGAPADLYIGAAPRWSDAVADARGAPDGVQPIATNTLVVVARAEGGQELASPAALADAPFERLALADPEHVPAGAYAKQALAALGVLDAVAERTVAAQNVRLALAYVARCEADLGIVYATDARSEPRVRVVCEFPPSLHDPIVYPAVLLRDATDPARAFHVFLTSPAAREILTRHGFGVP